MENKAIKIVKISCADSTRSWSDHRNPMIFKFLPQQNNMWRDCRFFWNDSTITKADFWVIIGDVDLDQEFCEVDRRNIILMTTEPQSIKRYDVSADFIMQFGRVFSSQSHLKHPLVFPCKPPINWWIDGGNPIKSVEEFQKWQGDGLSYNDFKSLHKVNKEKLLSVFCSNKTFTEGHKARFNFCLKLKNHFKDKLDWFGNGIQPVESKWHGIAPYKYHIALENSNSSDYWTEKLMDPLMVMTHPIYYGATNIDKYFSTNHLTVIDIKYPRLAISKIEKLISENFYEKNLTKLIEARDLVMDKYNLFNLIAEIVEVSQNFCSTELITIRKEKFFLLQTSITERKLKRNFFSKILRSTLKRINVSKNFLIDFLLIIKLKFIKNDR